MDIKNFSANGSGQTIVTQADNKWWSKTGKEASDSVSATLNFLGTHQGARQTQYLISARLYGNLAVMGLNGLTYSKVASVQNSLKDRISYNVCQSATDTVVSKIAKNKPKPQFLTSKGDYKIQRRAEKLNQFVDGIFYENRAYELGTSVFRDSVVWGDGVTHVFAKDGRVKFERVMAGELFVDEIEAFWGSPRQLHRVKNVDRSVLAAAFPDSRKDILNANAALPDTNGSYPNISDMVTVRESWRLPSGPKAKDGRHMITIDGAAPLFQEKWSKKRFPFAFMRWCKRLYGFWSQGGIEQIQNIQLELNKALWVMQRSFHLAGSFKVLMENGSKIVKEHINNDIGAIISYANTPPQYITTPPVPAELFQYVKDKKNDAFEVFGISQLSAASRKPEGLNSGKALREYNDIESERFMSIGQAYEQYHLDAATLAIDVAKDIYEDDGDYEVVVPNKKFTETVKWSEIDLEEDEYVMKCFPVSGLKGTPSDNLQTIQEYAQAGYLQPREARRLLDFPDLDAVETLANSAEDYLHEILEKIVNADLEEIKAKDVDELQTNDQVYTPPEPYDDLSLAREMALQYYQKGKTNGLEEEKLELLRRFIEQVEVLQKEAVAQAQPQLGAPQASPMPAPTSDLIPNVPQGPQ